MPVAPSSLRSELTTLAQDPRHVRAVASILALASYVLAGGVTRLVLTAAHASAHETRIIIFGYEFHHALIGIACLLATGLLALNDARPRLRAILFGVGAALVVDEIALLVELQPSAYFLWENVAGLVVGGALLFANVLYSRDFIARAASITVRHVRPRPT